MGTQTIKSVDHLSKQLGRLTAGDCNPVTVHFPHSTNEGMLVDTNNSA